MAPGGIFVLCSGRGEVLRQEGWRWVWSLLRDGLRCVYAEKVRKAVVILSEAIAESKDLGTWLNENVNRKECLIVTRTGIVKVLRATSF